MLKKISTSKVWKSASQVLRSNSYGTLIKRHDTAFNYMTKYYLPTQNPTSFGRPSTCILHNYCVLPCRIYSTQFKPCISNSKEEKIKEEMQKSSTNFGCLILDGKCSEKSSILDSIKHSSQSPYHQHFIALNFQTLMCLCGLNNVLLNTACV